MKLALLCSILNAINMSTCNVATLLADARCFCPVTVDPAEMVELQLLCDIAAAVGGGGGGGGLAQMVIYTGTDPTSDGLTPANINQPAMAYKADGTGSLFTWDTTNHVWI